MSGDPSDLPPGRSLTRDCWTRVRSSASALRQLRAAWPPWSAGRPPPRARPRPRGHHTLYASPPSGTGTTCSAAQPCSLTAAQTAVRALNSAMSGDIVVELADGVYRLSAPLRLTAADSGNNGYTVIWQAAASARPVDQRRPGGHRLVAGRLREEHLAGQRRRRDRRPAALRQRRRRHPGTHRREPGRLHRHQHRHAVHATAR